LVELLLVLGLMVAVGGLAYPALRGPWAKRRLQAAANDLRIRLAQLRLRAIESGEAQEFCYVPGKSRFRTGAQSWLPPTDPSAQQDLEHQPRMTAGGGRAAPPLREAAPVALPRWDEDLLPEPVRFAEVDYRLLPVPLALEPPPASTDAMDEPSGETWSAPIRFQPDGTATNGSIKLANEQGMQIEIQVSGLTGLASVGDLERIEDAASSNALPP
jgi:type II secretory pathway pseudopilin PulG